jgi:NDP-sugar pyrophosphorylase family protein
MMNKHLLENEKIRKQLAEFGIIPAQDLISIALIGGKGTRLNQERKLIRQQDYPQLNPQFWNKEGPKGLAKLSCTIGNKKITRPMIEWHLDIHAHCAQVKKIILALGYKSDMIIYYFNTKYNNTYKSIPLEYLVEKNPAGTLAPIIKLYQQGELPTCPTVYANSDNLMDMNLYHCYLAGLLAAAKLNIDINQVVIDVLSLVPWEKSAAYGTVDLDFNTRLVKGFKEKSPVKENTFIDYNGRKMTPINSGFSIVVNPLKLYSQYLNDDIINTCIKLENRELEYKVYEKVVKYETLYARVARDKNMVGIFLPVYWTDLGDEKKIIAAEKMLPMMLIFN